jgi:crossover junction endodeoxyribonuclease RuvC
MRILGIDCGTELTGYGVIDTDGRHHELVTAGVLRSRTAEPLEKRLHSIASGLRTIHAKFMPEVVAVEEVFHAVNTKSALKLAHVRGVALLTAAEAGVTVSEYSPLEVKMSVVGYGRAEKQQVQLMVLSLLGVRETFTTFDASDALAVAICHGTRASFAAQMTVGR